MSAKENSGNIIAWLALAVSILGFAVGGVRSHDLDDMSAHERLARLEAQVQYLKDAVNRLLDAGSIARPPDKQ